MRTNAPNRVDTPLDILWSRRRDEERACMHSTGEEDGSQGNDVAISVRVIPQWVLTPDAVAGASSAKADIQSSHAPGVAAIRCHTPRCNTQRQATSKHQQIFVVFCHVVCAARLPARYTQCPAPRPPPAVTTSVHAAFESLLYVAFSMTGKGWGYEGRLGGSHTPTAHSS